MKGNFDKALKHYLDSQKIYKEIGNLQGVATCLNNIGNIYATKKEQNRALKYYNEALNIYKEIDNDKKIIELSSIIKELKENDEK